MNLHRTIDLPHFEVIHKIINDVLQTQQLSQIDGVYPLDAGIDMHQWMQRIDPLVRGLKLVGLYEGWVATSIVLTYKEIPIHKDHAPEFHYSLNLPILNTEDTYTCFYESDELPETRWLPNGLPYDAYDPAKCRMIDRVEILQPTLLNVKVPHSVVLNNNRTPRITMALRMNHD